MQRWRNLSIGTVALASAFGLQAASGGPCNLATTSTAETRSLSTGLATIEHNVFQPLSQTFARQFVDKSTQSGIATPRLKFDQNIQQSLQTLATAGHDLSNLSDMDKNRLLIDPLRTSPAKLNIPPVATMVWDGGVVRATTKNATPYYTVGDNGTMIVPSRSPQPSPARPPQCGQQPGRADDPSCFFALPPLPIGNVDQAQLNARRRAIAELATVLILVRSEDGRRQVCTGTHLGGGLLLTAHHCHQTAGFKAIDYQILLNINMIDDPWPQGITAHALDGDDQQASALDFLFLKMETVPDKFAGAFLKLSARDPWTSCQDGADLESYLTWHENDSKFTKRYSADSQCVTKRTAVCYGKEKARVHSCDTSDSSSGAPILLRGGTSIVAVHTNGRIEDDSNCAIPTAEIKNALMDGAGKFKFPEAATIVWGE